MDRTRQTDMPSAFGKDIRTSKTAQLENPARSFTVPCSLHPDVPTLELIPRRDCAFLCPSIWVLHSFCDGSFPIIGPELLGLWGSAFDVSIVE
jgi:hypothetical protein